jgi:hypothetical protein
MLSVIRAGGCLLVMAACPSGWATVVSLIPAKDNSIFSEGELSSGSGQYLFAGVNSRQPTLRRGLIEFDVAGAVPAGAHITSASLTLHVSNSNGTPATVGLYHVNTEWGEGTSDSGTGGRGAPATISDATWIHSFSDTSLWSMPGGDFSPSASSAVMIVSPGSYAWGSTGPLVNDVQAWVDDQTTNHGWLLKDAETTFGTAKRFDSRENTADVRPALLIEYSGGFSLGDVDRSGQVDAADISAMTTTLADLSGYQSAGHLSDFQLLYIANLTGGDNLVSNADLQGLINLVAASGSGTAAPTAVPEPATIVMIFPILAGLALRVLGARSSNLDTGNCGYKN